MTEPAYSLGVDRQETATADPKTVTFNNFNDFALQNNFSYFLKIPENAARMAAENPRIDAHKAYGMRVASDVIHRSRFINDESVAVNASLGTAIVTMAEQTGEMEGNLHHVVFSQWDSTYYVFTEQVTINAETHRASSTITHADGWEMGSLRDVSGAYPKLSERFKEEADPKNPKNANYEASYDAEARRTTEIATATFSPGVSVDIERQYDLHSRQSTLSLEFNYAVNGKGPAILTAGKEVTEQLDRDIVKGQIEYIKDNIPPSGGPGM